MASWFTSTILPILPLFTEPLALVGDNRGITSKPTNAIINPKQVLETQTKLQMSAGSGSPAPQFRLSSAPYVYEGPTWSRGALAVAVIAIGTTSIYLWKERQEHIARGGKEDPMEEFYQLAKVGVRELLGDGEKTPAATRTAGGKAHETTTHQKKFTVVNNPGSSSGTTTRSPSPVGIPYQTRHDSHRE